jgi:hypothetical protein
MPQIEQGPVKGSDSLDDELALLREARKRNQRYMIVALMAFGVSFLAAIVFAMSLVGGVEKKVNDVEGKLGTLGADCRT